MGSHYRRLLHCLPILEGMVFIGAVYGAVALRLGTDPELIVELVAPVWPEASLVTAVLLVSMAAAGLYNPRLRTGFAGVLARMLLAFGAATAIIAAIFYAVADFYLDRGMLAIALVAAFVVTAILRGVIFRIGSREQNKRRVLVLGAGRRAGSMARLRRRTDLLGLRIVGFVPNEGDAHTVARDRQVTLDRPLVDWVLDNNIDEIVVAADERRVNLDMHQLLLCRERGVLVTDLPTFVEREAGRVCLDVMLPGWLVYSRGFSPGLLTGVNKRLLDIALSTGLLVTAAPVMVLAAFAIWAESGFRGPILYRQTRVGLNGHEFELLKFRSMRTDAEADGCARWASMRDPRVTRVGACIRRYRIDELPQIWNILCGEMSFVGPRPERPEFANALGRTLPHYAERHWVKPGLTGWAQVSRPYGASEEDASEKLQYDLYYVKNRCLYLDLVILLRTAEVVLWGSGAR